MESTGDGWKRGKNETVDGKVEVTGTTDTVR